MELSWALRGSTLEPTPGMLCTCVTIGRWQADVAGALAYLPKLSGRRGVRAPGLKDLGTSEYDSDMSQEVSPLMVRVQLDYDGGKLTFIDRLTKNVLKTFTATFTEKVFPFLDLDSDGSFAGLTT